MSDVAGVIVLVGRILIVIFPAYISGIGFHIRYPKMAEGYAKSIGFPVPAVTGVPAGLWLVASSLSMARRPGNAGGDRRLETGPPVRQLTDP